MRFINIQISNTRFETRDVQNRIIRMKSEKENDHPPFMHHPYPHKPSLSPINTRISNTRFKIRDVQNRIKTMKIENLKPIMSLPRTHIRLDDS